VLDVSGSIVTYKTHDLELKRAAESFLSAPLRTKLFVIDNSPTDALRVVSGEIGAEYIHVGRNIGFGAAHNIALKASMGAAPYHVVLNPDVYFDPGVLVELASFLNANSSVGLVMPKILFPDGSLQYLCKKLPTPLDIFARRFFPERVKALFKSKMLDYELRTMDFGRILSVPYLSGCFMFLRMESLREVGGFDEQFFMYYEDLDLTRRIRTRYDTVYYPGVAAYHLWKRESYRSFKLLMHHCSSAIKYFNKWGWIWDRQREEMNAAICSIDYQAPPFVENDKFATAKKFHQKALSMEKT